MDSRLKELFEKPLSEWTDSENEYFDNLRDKSKTAGQVMKSPVDDWSAKDENLVDRAKATLPQNTIKLRNDEIMTVLGQNAKPLTHTVKKGESLKEIAEMYSVSYGELSNHLMSREGSTSIHEGQTIEIPRYYVDLTEAV